MEFERIRETKEWKTGKGDRIAIEDLESSHIQNIIILLTEKQRACTELGLGAHVIYGTSASEWISLLSKELAYRRNELVEEDKYQEEETIL